MSSKSRPTASSGSSKDELLLPNAVQSHQLDAIRDPRVPTRALAAGIALVARPIRGRIRLPTPSKRLNDALRPAT
ncbi:MAG: hypothetical protein WKF52_04510 [Sphingomicrobium sp.]